MYKIGLAVVVVEIGDLPSIFVESEVCFLAFCINDGEFERELESCD